MNPQRQPGFVRDVLNYWSDAIRVAASKRAGRRRFLRHLLYTWAVLALGLWVTAAFLPGFEIRDWLAAVVTVGTIALLGAVLRPVMLYATLPLTVFTFGLLTFVMSAGLILLVSWLLPGFQVAGFATALLGSLVLSAINTIVFGIINISSEDSFFLDVAKHTAGRRAEVEQGDAKPGMVILQIDGLSEEVLRFAIRTGLMPTLARWVREGSHRIVGWECQLPSQTSASQAGILYGNNFDIPAFRWYDKDLGRSLVSNRQSDAKEIHARISDGTGLLAPSGAVLNTLLSGDAGHTVITMSALGNPETSRPEQYYNYFANPFNYSRSLYMTIREIAIELWQARRQRERGVEPRIHRSGSFPLLRAATTVILKDLMVSGIFDHIHSGTPIIYANFLSYDEVAHHAGPERPESLAMLADIDRQIAILQRGAKDAPRRYHFVVLSDHGQSQGATFRQRYGESLEELVQTLVGPKHKVRSSSGTTEGWANVNALINEFANSLGGITVKVVHRLFRSRLREGQVELGPDREPSETDLPDLVVSASGNLGLVHFSRYRRRLTLEDIEADFPGIISGMAEHDGIGFVMVRSQARGLMALGKNGVNFLDEGRVEGTDPLVKFGPQAKSCLLRLDTFPHVGDLVVNSLYDTDTQEVAAFEELVGSHGGLGGPQTKPFILFPGHWTIEEKDIVGAHQVYGVLCRWRDEDLIQSA